MLLFDLSGLGLRLRGLDRALTESFGVRWAPFRAAAVAAPLLDVEVQTHGAPTAGTHLDAKRMRASLEGGTARFEMEGGSIALDAAGRAAATLVPTTPERRFFTLVNLLGAGLAWRLPDLPGALLHAASLVLDGRAFVLVGPSGAGKTTWAREARRAGAVVLSDEMAFLDAAGVELEVLSTPLRADRAAPQGPGRFRLAALLYAEHGAPARLEPAPPPLLAAARLAANLPYVGELLERDPRVECLLNALAARAPSYTLRFAPDPAFVGCLRELLARRG
ncbi:MAG TPA: hypothetical protein VJS92_15485 [Candidatus Polarisedimenticolaceae bacterium]|nr:hypothetical protein [Candidatus Polarisedimenticolaceae bacterium]